MKRTVCILLVLLAIVPSSATLAASSHESFSFGPFGKVFLYGRKPKAPVVLFLSGDGGWNRDVIDMARTMSNLGSNVVGVDMTRYRKHLASSGGSCLYPAADFEALSKYIQKKLKYPDYTLPVLAGYSSGAALVYAALAQAPPNTFRGGISLGFCPELKLSKPLCRGEGLQEKPGIAGRGALFLPDKKLETPWIILQGAADKVCRSNKVRSFVRNIPEADLVILPKAGHKFSVQRHWLPQLRTAFERLMKEKKKKNTVAASLNDLPIVEVPAQGKRSNVFAVIISGDGGWAGLDREVGGALARRGVPVAGLNALRYFWTKRTPAGASEDLARIVRHYQRAWKRKDVLLIGYSLGADVLPFMANRLPPDLLDHVREIVLLGPSTETEFEFHIAEWAGTGREATARPVFPEVERLRGKRVLCVYGSGESESLCPELEHGLAESIRMTGGHHFGGKYETIAGMILDRISGR